MEIQEEPVHEGGIARGESSSAQAQAVAADTKGGQEEEETGRDGKEAEAALSEGSKTTLCDAFTKSGTRFAHGSTFNDRWVLVIKCYAEDTYSLQLYPGDDVTQSSKVQWQATPSISGGLFSKKTFSLLSASAVRLPGPFSDSTLTGNVGSNVHEVSMGDVTFQAV
eukprot:TRINITY_DN31527_c0_g1_i2.p1 TRINITY_DN31527_c0_g1~~TRINITY_DN31527_c0_g1_i2.p1  ORF type:complete len:166 (-),score=23.18 TRINITY_DN31527_c0_g1_i2:73-570(-)